MDPTTNPLMTTILQPQNVAVVLATAVVIYSFQRAFPAFFAKPAVVRVLPLVSMPICIGLLWIPGLAAGAQVTGVGDRVMLGIILSWGLTWAFKVVRQTGMKKDKRLQ